MKFTIIQCAREIRPGGGVCGVAYNLEKQFLRSGFNCTKFTQSDVGLKEVVPSQQSIVAIKLRMIRDILWYSIYGTAKLARRVHRQKNSIVICHSDMMFGDIYVNHSLHRAWLSRRERPFFSLIRNPFHIFLLVREKLRFASNIHKRIVCFCKSDADLLKRFYPKLKQKIYIIPNGVDINRFYPKEKKNNKVRSELGINQQDFVLIFIAHEFEHKGLKFVIDALSKLPSHVHLLIVGEPSSHASEVYSQYSKKRGCFYQTHFLGTRSDTATLLNASNLLVLPSKGETWALVGLEALACGVPILMTAVGGITEYLKNGKNGYFISRDAKNIADKTQFLIEHPGHMQQLSKCSRQTALTFSWENVAERYLELVCEVAKEKWPGD